MADTNLLKRRLQDRMDSSDPFAELTRIMAREPRAEAPSLADDPFDIDLEKELMGDLGDGLADGPGPAVEAYASDAYAPQAYAPAPRDEDARFAASHDRASAGPADDAFAVDFDQVDWDGDAEETLDEPQAAYPAGQDWPAAGARDEAPAAAPAQDPFGDDLGLAEVDMDFGDLEVDDRAAAASGDEAVETEGGAAYGEAPEAIAYEAEPQRDVRFARAAPQADAFSLEDELNRLLGGGSPLGAGQASYEMRDDAAETPYAGHAAYDHADDASSGDSGDDVADAPVAEDGWPEAAAEPEPAAEPFAVFSRIAPAMPPLGRTHAAPAGYAGADAAAPSEPFDIETVDVAGDLVPAQDELDLPEAHFDEPAPAYVDFDTDFATSFGELRARQPQPEPAPAGYGDDQFAEAIGLSGAAAATASDGWGARARAAVRDEAEGDLDQEIGVAGYEAAAYEEPVPASRPRRRNGLVVAAAVAAVALLGGVGALALSFGGGESGDTPVLVKADAKPLKVKPENPGGASVPNQDSKAYERASGVVDTRPPEQKKLVTAVEEPVALTAADKVAAAGADPVPGPGEAAGVDGDGAISAKAEDRLEAAPEPDGVGAAEDLAAVQPRKVRTMVVRPDGTLVPREEPVAAPEPAIRQAAAPAPRAEPAETVAAPAAQAIREVAITTPPSQQPAAAQPQAAQPQPKPVAAERVAAMPEKGPAVPQRPTEAPAVAAASQQQQQHVAQAAAPARAQPARPEPAAPQGASDWSMQIASQPTAEAAQSTYQDLARRYGSVIGGRGVNIVKAEVAGKGTYYRVRVPSATRDEAIALCEKYKAAGGSCFVSK